MQRLFTLFDFHQLKLNQNMTKCKMTKFKAKKLELIFELLTKNNLSFVYRTKFLTSAFQTLYPQKISEILIFVPNLLYLELWTSLVSEKNTFKTWVEIHKTS
jgi:hypothetical protein